MQLQLQLVACAFSNDCEELRYKGLHSRFQLILSSAAEWHCRLHAHGRPATEQQCSEITSAFGGTADMGHMQWREFITLLGGAAATWPVATPPQQPVMPAIGFTTWHAMTRG